jgi:nucleoporin NDC1
LKEDRYGVVQRDLPKILEAFLSFLGALEDYRAEIVEGCPTHDDIAASSGKEQEDKLRTLQEITEAVEPLDRLQHGAFLSLASHVLLIFDVSSSEKWRGRNRWHVRGVVVGLQVPSQGGEEVAGIHGRENEP